MKLDENNITIFFPEYLSSFSSINPYEPLKLDTINRIPETAPKYDPNRLFKKGDKVRFKEYHGRKAVMYSGTNSWFNHPPSCKNGILVVKEDEKESRVKIGIITADCAHATTAPCYLELVTPVEEIEPYGIADHIHGWIVYKDNPGNVVANFNKTHPHAKEAAEAERDRLNAEYRKEQE